jgi:prophage maintenance system killer protein
LKEIKVVSLQKIFWNMEDKIAIYKDENNAIQLEVRMDGDMLWLTRQQLALLFGRDYKTISKHINNALKEELAGEVVVAKFANTTQHGAIENKTQAHDIEHFNLEMVTSIGYRVKSRRGVQFRKWAKQAAMLLYLVTKNHSFSDGNKRIAATLFLWFLNNNGILYREDGSKRLADNTLVALTLMIAESRTEEKDVMVKVVVNLINQQNV